MTENNPIMINEIDVSKCKRLIANKIYGYVCNCEEDTHLISSCKNRPNCYFKQLARKTQECDQLKAEKEQLEQKLKQCDGIDCAWCTRVDCPREEHN